MESSKQPNQVEKKAFLQEENAIPPLNPNAMSQSRSSEDIWEEMKIVLARLRFFEHHCVCWKTAGLAGTEEQAFLTLTINHLEKMVEGKHTVTRFPIGRFSGGAGLKNEKSQS